jgi:heptosyltransferase-2
MAHASAVNTLIIAPAWVGDMVMAHTLVQRLAHNGCDIDVLAPPASAPLATRMAEVRDVHIVNFAHGEFGLGKRRRLGYELREREYAQAFVLPNSWKSALLPFFAKIPRRTGWLGEARYGLLNDHRKLDKSQYPLMIERFMALADPDGQLPPKPYTDPRLRADASNAERLRAALQVDAAERGDEQIVALAPGAEFGPAKKWPHYAELARSLRAQGKAVWLFGSPKDAPDCQSIAHQVAGVVNLAGKTSLLDALDLLSLADHVVCNDSGLMHIACALDIPTTGIFGSTSPQFTPPLGERAQTVQLSLDCQPCFERTCPLGHLNCLNQLPAEQVLSRIEIRA